MLMLGILLRAPDPLGLGSASDFAFLTNTPRTFWRITRWELGRIIPPIGTRRGNLAGLHNLSQAPLLWSNTVGSLSLAFPFPHSIP